MEIAEFLRACVAEDKAGALAATQGPWTVDSEVYAETIYGGDDFTDVVSGGRWGGEASVFESTEDAKHIARWDPARVIAECDAKLRIVERLTELARAEGDETYGDASVALTDTLRLLALPYADRPGYREEWRR